MFLLRGTTKGFAKTSGQSGWIDLQMGGGLAIARHHTLLGFYVAGSDGRFFAADARIEGDTVICSSEQIAEPVHVMFNFFSRRTGTKEDAKKNKWAFANLFNKNGLPALPFTTLPFTDYTGELKEKWPDQRK